jgi:hypothetical protein
MDVVLVVFGIGSLYGAFSPATKLRALFSRGKGPAYPISLTGRIALGTLGAVLLIEGIFSLTR